MLSVQTESVVWKSEKYDAVDLPDVKRCCQCERNRVGRPSYCSPRRKQSSPSPDAVWFPRVCRELHRHRVRHLQYCVRWWLHCLPRIALLAFPNGG